MSSPQYNRPAAAAGSAAQRAEFVDAAADQCVKCALCLPVCPTWTLTRDEAESPRGRIALLQGVAKDMIAAADAAPHLDRCLNCMACQSVCPANVPYGALVDAGQTMLRERGAPRSWRTALAARTLESPAPLRALAALHRVARRVPGLGAVNVVLQRILSMPDNGSPSITLPAPTVAGDRGTVIVLQGCVSDAFERDTTRALGLLLNAVGYGVREVAGCCGALSRHSGDSARANALSNALIEQVAALDAEAVVHPATGCAAVLREVDRHVDSPAAGWLASRMIDAAELLSQADLTDRLASLPAAAPITVALHAPCTQRNVTGGVSATRSLIDALPGVTCVSLSATSCCGAAGSTMLSEPDAADALAARTLAPLDEHPAVDVLLTPNVGCAWHLRGYRARTQRPLRVMHPALFLAERLHGAHALV